MEKGICILVDMVVVGFNVLDIGQVMKFKFISVVILCEEMGNKSVQLFIDVVNGKCSVIFMFDLGYLFINGNSW